jgi:ubiquinone/menaquinone biosynthesis C-methylase UbiE
MRPITEPGIGPDMRVLNLGCGAGDAAMLAAELVGLSRSVVGIDRNPQILAVAAQRARPASGTSFLKSRRPKPFPTMIRSIS